MISTKGRYGMRVSLELALNYGGQPVPVRKLAEDQQISEKYLEHIIAILKNAGLVKSIRGASGGYILSRHPSQINLLEILKPLEGEFASVECLSNPDSCDRVEECVTRSLWQMMARAVEDVLTSMTLQDLINDYIAKNERGLTYYI